MAPASSSMSPHDAFARVSAALLAVWPRVRDQDAGLTVGERGLVLDECGSDYRPLVELLLDIGRQVRPALSPLRGVAQSAATWANTRAPLVHRLVATRYLQPDVARWAVDVWGQVLGVAPAPAPPVVLSATSALVADSIGPAGNTAVPPRPPAAPAGTMAPAGRRGTPGGAATAVPPRAPVAASSRGARRTAVGRPPSAPGPRYQPVERRAAIVLGLLLVIITVSLSRALRNRPAEAPAATDTPVTAAADTLVPVPDESAAPEPLVAAATPAPPLRNDTTLADTIALLMMHGGALPPTPRPAPGAVARSVIESGVGGRYRVTQRVRDVSGTASCEAVSRALGVGRETVEIVTHEPGTTTFALASREVEGTLSSDGWFTAQPRSGTTNNVNWQFRMRGRFGPDGFSAVSETYTEAIIRWGRTQHCVVTADLSGRRLPG